MCGKAARPLEGLLRRDLVGQQRYDRDGVGLAEGRGHDEGGQEQRQPGDHCIGRGRLRAECRPQQRQHDHDAGERGHHDQDRWRQRQHRDQRDQLQCPLGDTAASAKIQRHGLRHGRSAKACRTQPEQAQAEPEQRAEQRRGPRPFAPRLASRARPGITINGRVIWGKRHSRADSPCLCGRVKHLAGKGRPACPWLATLLAERPDGERVGFRGLQVLSVFRSRASSGLGRLQVLGVAERFSSRVNSASIASTEKGSGPVPEDAGVVASFGSAGFSSATLSPSGFCSRDFVSSG